MLYKLAWKNIWRNKLRTSVVLLALTFGIIVMILISGYANGIGRAFLKNSLEKQHAHVQIHHNKFLESYELRYDLDWERIEKEVQQTGLHYTPRSVAMGIVSTAGKSQLVKIVGIDTTLEKNVVNPFKFQTKGNGFKGTRTKPVFMGEALAQKLNVKLKSKVIITFNRADGSATKAKFKVTGLCDMKNKMLDETQLFIPKSVMNNLIGDEAYCNEILLLGEDQNKAVEIAQNLQQKVAKQVEVISWRKAAPELDLLEQQFTASQYIVRFIVLLALIFGIINTLLMSVLERTRELGMLIAIGLNKTKTFSMVLLESIFMSLVAGPVGILLTIIILKTVFANGFDLSFMASSFEQWGIEPIIKMDVDVSTYFAIMGLVTVVNMIGAVYPALKAINLKPAEAIRK